VRRRFRRVNSVALGAAAALFLVFAQDKEVAELVEKLGSDRVTVREAASTELRRLGKIVLPAMKRELDRATSEEVRGRLKTLIDLAMRPEFQRVGELPWMGSIGEFRPDGRQFALAKEGLLLLFDARTWLEERRVEPPKDADPYVYGLAYSPGGDLLAVRYARRVTLYSVPGFEEVFSTTMDGKIKEYGYDLRFIGANRFLFQKDSSHSLVMAERKQEGWVLSEKGAIEGFHFDVRPDGVEMAHGTFRVQFIDLTTWAPSEGFDGGKRGATSGQLAFSPDSRFFVMEGANLELIAMDRKNGGGVKRWNHPCEAARDMSFRFSGDSKYLVTGGGDGRLRAWECKTWTERASTPVGTVFMVRASPVDGTVVVSSRQQPEGKPARQDRTLIFRLAEP
jgi:WD40 repeat protein